MKTVAVELITNQEFSEYMTRGCISVVVRMPVEGAASLPNLLPHSGTRRFRSIRQNLVDGGIDRTIATKHLLGIHSHVTTL
jgi:hypothetical protein